LTQHVFNGESPVILYLKLIQNNSASGRRALF
jgi:hypothetical protein